MSADTQTARLMLSGTGCGLFLAAVTLYAQQPFVRSDMAAACGTTGIPCNFMSTVTCYVRGWCDANAGSPRYIADCSVDPNNYCDCDIGTHGDASYYSIGCDAYWYTTLPHNLPPSGSITCSCSGCSSGTVYLEVDCH
jgi:hypothetical protein